jgi:serine/threonine protein kinase
VERIVAGRYELHEPVGSGWRATDTELGRQVVVRLLPLGEPAPEARTATLAHPNVARVFDQGEADGETYVVREYLPGGSLEERLPALDEREAHAVAADVAAALAYAHAEGVTHGSLTAANVLFDGEGHAKVSGFTGAAEPEEDVRAFGALLESLAAAAPGLAPIAAAALVGELDSDELPARIREAEPAPAVTESPTLIRQPPARRATAARRGRGALVAATALALLAAGVGAAFLAGSGGSNAERRTGSLSVPVPSGSNASTADESGPPPSTSTEESTTEQKTTTEKRKTTTAPRRTTTTAPPVVPPTATVEPPSLPATTEEPPPTTTEEPPPPPTTAPPGLTVTVTTG